METKINKLIKESGLKKEYIAFKVDVSIYTLANWRKGKSYPNIHQANKLKEILKLNHIDELLDRDNKLIRRNGFRKLIR